MKSMGCGIIRRFGTATAVFVLALGLLAGCGGGGGSSETPVNNYNQPVLSDLVISDSGSNYIELQLPELSTPGFPLPEIQAYIGIDGAITVSGSEVSGYEQGPIDVTNSGARFEGLNASLTYRIIVIAFNSEGYSVKQIVQSTSGIAPVLNNIPIDTVTNSSIAIFRPSFDTSGSPLPFVEAYIGIDGVIAVTGSTVTGYMEGPVDVSTSGCLFSGLVTNTSYRIVVVAHNVEGYSVKQITGSTCGVTPVLNALAIESHDYSSITIEQPTMSTAGNPLPFVQAYIGVNGTVSVNGSTVTDYIQGPMDVSSGSYQFTGLDANTTYRIIVIAQNSEGYSTQQITQSTEGIAPVLDDLSIISFDDSSITIGQPAFSTAGNPSPTVQAYLGINGSISVSGSTVTGYEQGPVNVVSGAYQFSGLNANTLYKIIVVAQNIEGYSVKQITQSTEQIAPVLNGLSINSFDDDSIAFDQPTFSIAGNPAPTVQAYIGVNGTISVSGSTVSNVVQGPINVSTGGYQFSGLDSSTSYRIIVVAQNSKGYSVQQISQSTDGIAPVLNNLSITSFDAGSITINQPTFSTAGNPTPTVQAYIGVNGIISVSGSTVSNALQGPFDVSLGSHQFSGLDANTSYRIIVVAQNSKGYSVQQISQSTDGIAPVLNNLSITSFDEGSITIDKPTFSTAGNPAPTVHAYIGVNGTISVSGSTVSNSLLGPVDVSSGSHQFSGLDANSSYRIIVVAQNSKGYSMQQIAQSTDGIAPVLNNLSITSFDEGSITIDKPTFSTAGNPAPTVHAYIGVDGTISVNGSTVSNYTQGPVDVSTSSYQFASLNVYTAYRVIIVAQNIKGYSSKSIVQSTSGIAPVMNMLSLENYSKSTITLSKPDFSTVGNPAPSVNAYIGIDGTIQVIGDVVTGYLQSSIDVSMGSYQFSGLDECKNYRIVVVAKNIYGSSVKQISQITDKWVERIIPGTTSPNTWNSIASSTDGLKLVASGAGGTYTSIDGGITWTKRNSNNWVSISSSSDGQYLAACSTGYIFTSSDGGMTWIQRTAAGNRSWLGISSSPDGSIIVACVNSGYIYKSVNGGETWEELTSAGSKKWFGVTTSSNGIRIAAVDYYGSGSGGYIYTSSDGGITWNQRSTAEHWYSITSSSDGMKIAACSSNGNIRFSNDGGETWLWASDGMGALYSISSSSDGMKLVASVTSGGNIYTSVDGGYSWILRSSAGSKSWTCVSYSGDGSRISAVVNGGYIYTSSDNGATWTEIASVGVRVWSNVACSSDGLKMASVVGGSAGSAIGYIYTSSDGGVTWVERLSSGMRGWYCIASSSDGQKLAAGVGSGYNKYIYTSSDGGLTWTSQVSAGNRYWYSIASSSDGMKLSAVGGGTGSNTTGYIYTSTDGGVTWLERTSAGLRYWSAITSSSDGLKLAACNGNWSSTGNIYTSIDGGENWVERSGTGSRYWHSIASSSDGLKLVAVGNNMCVYTSSDGGSNWVERTNSGNRNWFGVTSSSDGMIIAAAVGGGYIYTSKDGGATWSERTSAGSRSWRGIATSAFATNIVAVATGETNLFTTE